MRRICVLVTLGLLALAVGPALAQQSQYSAMQGRILDESGLALPGVVIVVTHQESGMFRQVVSNADGSYFVTGLVPGPYRITAELAGFKKYERADVLLTIGNTSTLDIALAVGVLEESVTVTGEAPLVDTTSKQIGANIGTAEIAALPILNRNWMFAVSLAPGIQIQSSTASFACESLIVGGGSNRSGNFSVDGGGNNDDYLGSSCGSQVRPALEAVQEFQVLTNQYDAEFGRTAGAVVNVITKQGTNSFHGTLFETYTDDKVTAPDFFVAQNNLVKPKTSQADWGGTIGGPVKKDKAHFFYSLDRIVYNEGRTNTFVARPELNVSNTQTMKLWNHMARFDHQINATNTWSARYLVEYSPTYNRLSPQRTLAAKDQEFDIDRTTGGNWSTVYGNNRFNQVRVGYTHEANGFAPAAVTPVPNGAQHMIDMPPTLSMLTFTDGLANNASMRINDAYEISETFTQFVPHWVGGDHDLKFGVQYIFSKIGVPDEGDMNGRFSFATDRPFNANDPSTYPERLFIRVPAAQDYLVQTHVGVAFAQDKWHLRDLTLNMGVRYDLEITPLRNAFNPFFKTGSHVVDKNNVAPRIGFAWKPGGSEKSLIRGGYGIFYDKIVLQTLTQFVTNAVYTSSFVASFPTDRADSGPSRGQLPTDPMLVNGSVVNRARLNALFPPGSMGRNNGVVFLDNPDRVVPNVHQLTIGYQRELDRQMAATIDYVHSWNRDQLVNFDLNPARRVDTSRTGRLVYTDLENIAGRLGISPFTNQVLTRRNDGSSQFDGVNFMLEKRFSDHWAARASYAIGYARGNVEPTQHTTNDNNYQLLGDPRLDLNYGPLDADRRHNLTISGRVEVPWTHGLTISGVYRYLSGRSMTLYNSAVDADQNGRLFDLLPAGTYSGSGANAITVENKGGRNGAKGPTYRQADIRFGYRFRPGKETTIDANLDLFNIFNKANFDNPSGDQRVNFLRLVTLRGGNGQPRAAQFSVRFGF
ncbi:MAG: TonB-dependent receptor [Acidobacteria bacterium]|nr:TonB-dependent receptor [Acidobacteriota bacterium]